MKLQDAIHLTADISNIPISLLNTDEDFINFSNAYRFHAVQKYLAPDLLMQMRHSHSFDVMCSVDIFQVRFIFCALPEGVLVIGPYCTELITKSDRLTILKRLHLTENLEEDLNVYRSQFTISTDSFALHLLHSIGRSMDWKNESEQVYRVDFRDIEIPAMPEPEPVQLDYRQMIQKRYAIEHQFLENIKSGNQNAAINDWKYLHRSVSYIKNLGHTLEMSRIAAGVFRTTIRIAADEVGISAYINDQVSSQSSKIIQKAKTIDEIDQEHERLIKEYCKIIRQKREENYSNLVISVLYHLEHKYAEDISIAGLANELSITENHLITAFRKETGTTPNSYLCCVRMRKAAELLTSTSNTIQEISSCVGIIDNNYFTKLFKKEYGQTPTSYRKRNTL